MMSEYVSSLVRLSAFQFSWEILKSNGCIWNWFVRKIRNISWKQLNSSSIHCRERHWIELRPLNFREKKSQLKLHSCLFNPQTFHTSPQFHVSNHFICEFQLVSSRSYFFLDWKIGILFFEYNISKTIFGVVLLIFKHLSAMQVV